MGCKIFIGSNDGQSIQIYFFDLFVRRNENSIINVAHVYIYVYVYIIYPSVGNRRERFILGKFGRSTGGRVFLIISIVFGWP